MSAPQNQPPYQPPYQPQYQAVPPYGQQRPRQTHVGKLVVAVILFVIGPLMGLAIWGIGSVIAVASIATSGDVVTNGQQVSLSSNDERALYLSLIHICRRWVSGSYRSKSHRRDGNGSHLSPAPVGRTRG